MRTLAFRQILSVANFAKHQVGGNADGHSGTNMGSILDRILELAAAKTLVISSVNDETKTFRKSVCDGCEKRDVYDNRCKVCKCYLAVKTGTLENRNPIKLRYEITHCPLGKWNDLEIANHYREIDGLPLLLQP